MVVLVLTACPAGLRGHITRWLLEISPGVFVGVVTAKVRDLLWSRVLELCKDGKALMVHSTRGEQRLTFRVHRHEWEPVDVDGVWLMRRPSAPRVEVIQSRRGWSYASRRRRRPGK
ncbi:MAG: type I-E CRISPR-associated endoribonuclease Cas2e [Actinomycetales bacterium]